MLECVARGQVQAKENGEDEETVDPRHRTTIEGMRRATKEAVDRWPRTRDEQHKIDIGREHFYAKVKREVLPADTLEAYCVASRTFHSFINEALISPAHNDTFFPFYLVGGLVQVSTADERGARILSYRADHGGNDAPTAVEEAESEADSGGGGDKSSSEENEPDAAAATPAPRAQWRCSVM